MESKPGITGEATDISAKKEVQRLKLEAERQDIFRQEELIKVVRKIAHDINSPLTSLKMILPACDALPEMPRTIINQAISSMADIANNLFATYKKVENKTMSGAEPRLPLLVADLLMQLLSQKKIEYSNRAVKFETEIDNNAHFAFALMQHSQFSNSISNLINNAVDALGDEKNGVIKIKLAACSTAIIVTIQNNGKGVSTGVPERALDRQGCTADKEDGQGGLQQVWDTLDNNEGYMKVDCTDGDNTAVHVAFPRIKAANWLAHKIQPVINGIVVIMDDDESIHGAWDIRFNTLLKSHSALQLYHFTDGQETLNFFSTLSTSDKNHVLFLSDFDLVGQVKNGMEIIEESGIKNTILVTSYYANPQIQDRATQLGIKILPKQMASIVPIDVDASSANHVSTVYDEKNHNLCDGDLKDIDVIFVDDEEYLLNGFKFFAAGKKVDTYCDPAIFLKSINQYGKNTKIMLDQNFANYDLKGIQIAEQLYAMGFHRLYLLSGNRFSSADIPHFLTYLYKGEMDMLQAALDE